MPLPATTYYVRTTYAFAGGLEGPSSLEASQFIGVGGLLTVVSPPPVTGATGWNVYVGPTAGVNLLQNSTPIAIGTNWVEPAFGLYFGPQAPSPCLFEMLSYEVATLTAANKYDLKTYLRRGQYGTPNVDHASGEPFGRTDSVLIKMPYNPAQIGQTIHVKYTSFNVFGGAEEDISSVTDYPHIIQGPPPLPRPTNLTVSILAGTYTISWDDLRNNPQLAPAVSGYDVLYGATNLLGPVTPIALGYTGNSITTNFVPAGSWAIFVRGVT